MTCNGAQPLELGQDVEVRSTPRCGLGVYATRDIPIGTFATRYTGTMRSHTDQLAAMTAGFTTGDYAMGLGQEEWCIDSEDPPHPQLPWWSRFASEHVYERSWAHFMNHSRRRRNCDAVFLNAPSWLSKIARVPTEPAHVWFFTNRDIKAGEELVIDYGEAYWDVQHPLGVWLMEHFPAALPLYRMNPRRIEIDYL